MPSATFTVSFTAVTVKEKSSGSMYSSRTGSSSLYGDRNCNAYSSAAGKRSRHDTTHGREGVNRVPIRVPFVHHHLGWRDARRPKLLRNIGRKFIETRSAVCHADMEVLLLTCDLPDIFGQTPSATD